MAKSVRGRFNVSLYSIVKIEAKTVAAGKISVNERGEDLTTVRKRKNRVSQPEGGRKTRGIQNEHNVRLRRTRAPDCTHAGAEIV